MRITQFFTFPWQTTNDIKIWSKRIRSKQDRIPNHTAMPNGIGFFLLPELSPAAFAHFLSVSDAKKQLRGQFFPMGKWKGLPGKNHSMGGPQCSTLGIMGPHWEGKSAISPMLGFPSHNIGIRGTAQSSQFFPMREFKGRQKRFPSTGIMEQQGPRSQFCPLSVVVFFSHSLFFQPLLSMQRTCHESNWQIQCFNAVKKGFWWEHGW